MANSYKKKDNFLRNVLIGFGVTIVALVVGVTLLNIYGPSNSYDDFDKVTNYALIGQQTEDLYAVYFYSESCNACQQIKGRTMQFADNNELDMKVYMMDAATTGGDRSFISLGGQGLNSTPTMLIFKDGTLVNYYVGSDTIVDFYDDVENGNITFD